MLPARYVALDLKLEICALPNYQRAHIKTALLEVFSNRVSPGGRWGFFHPDSLTFGEGIFLSKIVATAQAVPGVECVEVTRFQRLFESANHEIENGVLTLRVNEIAQLDNDPNFPEHGKLEIQVVGDDDTMKKTCGCTAETCGCCEGIQVLTPQSTANRPGLSALNYRVGTHGTFLETMKARLTTMTVDVPDAEGQAVTLRPLLYSDHARPRRFFHRAPRWPGYRGDVALTFYQDRIANEGYLRMATERRSIWNCTTHWLRVAPGRGCDGLSAHTIDEDRSLDRPKPTATTIPRSSRVQSIPVPGELPQTFETEEDIDARSIWNVLQPHMTRPQDQRLHQCIGTLFEAASR